MTHSIVALSRMSPRRLRREHPETSRDGIGLEIFYARSTEKQPLKQFIIQLRHTVDRRRETRREMDQGGAQCLRQRGFFHADAIQWLRSAHSGVFLPFCSAISGRKIVAPE